MIALGLEYDGRAFCGWQRQANNGDARTSVQAALEAALGQIAQHEVSVVAAGRTDAGVHASLQVVHFSPPVDRPVSAWVRGVNAHLPASVSVCWAHPVPDDFHARFSATSRRYVYWLLDRDARPGLLAGRVGWTHHALDVSAMHAASQALVGTHDFSSFRASECQAKSPVKTLHSIALSRVGALVRLDVQANAFLHHMVRNIVGALVYVGAGKLPASNLAQLLAQKDRTIAPPTFSPDGLYLCGIEYPARFGLPQCMATPSLAI